MLWRTLRLLHRQLFRKSYSIWRVTQGGKHASIWFERIKDTVQHWPHKSHIVPTATKFALSGFGGRTFCIFSQFRITALSQAVELQKIVICQPEQCLSEGWYRSNSLWYHKRLQGIPYWNRNVWSSEPAKTDIVEPKQSIIIQIYHKFSWIDFVVVI